MNSIVNSRSVCIREKKTNLKRQTTTKLKIIAKNKTEIEWVKYTLGIWDVKGKKKQQRKRQIKELKKVANNATNY